MDEDPGGSTRISLGDGSVFQSVWLQRAIRTHNEAHRLLLDYLLYFLRCSWNVIFNIFSIKTKKS